MSPPRTTTERSEQTTLNVKQVVSLCERLWKEREDKLREEYDKVLNDRLSGKDIYYFLPKEQIKHLYQADLTSSYSYALYTILSNWKNTYHST